MIAVLLGLMFTNCVKDDFYFGLEDAFNYEIAESKEFQEYMVSQYRIMRKLTNPEEYCEKIFNSVIYDSVYFCSYDIFDDYYSAKKELIRKYPKYGKLPVAKKRELYGIAVSMLNKQRMI